MLPSTLTMKLGYKTVELKTQQQVTLILNGTEFLLSHDRNGDLTISTGNGNDYEMEVSRSPYGHSNAGTHNATVKFKRK